MSRVYCSHWDISWGLLPGRPSYVRVSIVIPEPLVNYMAAFLVGFNSSKLLVFVFRIPVLSLYCVYQEFSICARIVCLILAAHFFFPICSNFSKFNSNFLNKCLFNRSICGTQGNCTMDVNMDQALGLACIDFQLLYCCSSKKEKERHGCRLDISN